ncbi:MAG: DHHA1 domain-containing protein, partial [Chitinophagaceae bacterium]
SKDIVKSIEKLLEDKSLLERKISSLETRQLQSLSEDLAKNAKQINGMTFIGQTVEIESADALKQLCFQLKVKFERYIFALATTVQDKVYFVLMIDEHTAAEKNLDAAKIIREQISPLIKGGGGGQKTFATAGGKDSNHLQEVKKMVEDLIA